MYIENFPWKRKVTSIYNPVCRSKVRLYNTGFVFSKGIPSAILLSFLTSREKQNIFPSVSSCSELTTSQSPAEGC